MEDSEMQTPNYYSILPADVRYDKRLKASEKLLYAEITSLTSKTGKCWATNKFFADLYGVDVLTVSRWVANLKDCGYIDIEVEKSDGNRRVILLMKKSIGIDKKINGGIDKKINHNNININNTSDCLYECIQATTEVFDRFVAWWNDVLRNRKENVNNNVRKIQFASDERFRLFRDRWWDTVRFMKGEKTVESIFKYMTEKVIGESYINSNFLRGEATSARPNSEMFYMEFDRIFGPRMWTGMLEKKYHDRDLTIDR